MRDQRDCFFPRFIQHIIFGVMILPLLGLQANLNAGTFEKANNNGARYTGMGGITQGMVDDPTAIFHNPAAMTRRNELQAMFSSMTILSFLTFKPTGESHEKSRLTPFLLPFLGASAPLAGKWLYGGFALYTPFGNGFQFATTSPNIAGQPTEGTANNAVTAATLYIVEGAPSLAVKWRRFALGGALRADFSKIDLESHAGAFGGQVSQIAEDWDLGAKLGVTYDDERFKAGVMWRDTVDFEYSGYYLDWADTTSGRRSITTTALKVPEAVLFGASWRLTDSLTVGADAQWANYSIMDPVELRHVTTGTNATATSIIHLQGKDNYAIHSGLEYRLRDKYRLRGGYAFDGETSTNKTITRVFYNGPAHIWTLGSGYDNGKLRVDSAVEFAWASQLIKHDGHNFNPGEYRNFTYTLTFDLLVRI
ncbi:MAG: outer membrane protein transport protein [Deltaproteobacteria bacterium]|nr:outer membrane protein transport protein [Deltaproteobacteria bacterium]